jgi:LPXTG-motif cell wall-anchored protein
VEIVVNPGGDDLSPGDDANLNQPGDDTITVVDTMSPTLQFESISEIKVTYVDDGTDVIYTSLTYDPAQNAVTFAGLPDSTAIRIAYTAVVDGDVGDKVDISNAVWIAGYADSITEVTQKFTVMDSSASGAGEKASFYVRKTDSTDDSALADARFALYIEGEYTDCDDVWADASASLPDGVTQTITVGEGSGAKTYYYLISPGPTGADGRVSFQDEGWIKQGDNYLLVEIEAPPGYIGLEEPLLLHISYDGEEDENPDAIPDDAEVVLNLETLDVPNDPGIRFPETGGAGTGLYTAVGAAVMTFAATLLLISRRRRIMNNE